MKVRFFLKKKNVERSEIMLVIRQGTAGHNLREIRIVTGETVKPKQWSLLSEGKNRKDRQRINTVGANEVNEQLDLIETKVNDLVREARKKGIDPFPYIKENIYVSNVLTSKLASSVLENEKLAKAKENTVLYVYESFITECENKEGIEYTYGTVKGLRSKFESFRNFLGYRANRFRIEEISPEWFESWKEYMFFTLNLTNNTVEKHIKVLKQVLAWGKAKGLHKNQDFKEVLKTEKLVTQADTVALTQKEITALENLDLSNNTRLEEVRDLFLFEIYTSLRISDVKDFSPEQITNGNIYKKRSKKTGKILEFHLRPKCIELLNKYNGLLPTYKVRNGKGSLISEQKANMYIKEVCALIGLNKVQIERTRLRGKEVVKELLPKNEVISNHTGRRTFVTISFDAGHTERNIMKVTGHSDYKTLQKYDRPTLQENDRLQLRQWWNERGSV